MLVGAGVRGGGPCTCLPEAAQCTGGCRARDSSLLVRSRLPPMLLLPVQNRPAQCTAPRGEWLLVPFVSVLEYYLCE